MLCARCNLREAHNNSLCTTCIINTTLLDKSEHLVSDEEILDYHATRQSLLGCRKCGNKLFGFKAGVKYEEKVKWFIMSIDCRKCNTEYDELVEVRIIDEPNKYDKRTQ